MQTLVCSLLLLVATVALYWPVHSYPFVDFDDPGYVTGNSHIQGILNFSMVKWAVLHSYCYNWHPLTWMSHAVDIQLFGLQAGRHHEVNVLLHALNALLLFWVLKRATGFGGRSFMVAALFAVHPINVESVVWIAERKTLLSTLFFLLALSAYRWYARQPKLRRMAFVALFYGFGLMAKPQVIILPFVLLLWDYWPLGRMFAQPKEAPAMFACRSFRALAKEKIPLFFICAVDAVITMIAQHSFQQSGTYNLSLRLESAIVCYVQYVRQAFWPSGLAILYLYPSTFPWWQVPLALLFLMAIGVLVYALRRHRYLAVGWLWFLGSLVPMIGVVAPYPPADRYAYVSFIGIFLMVCWGVADWAGQLHAPRAALPAASLAVLLALAVTARRQMECWQDSVTLWTHTIQVSPPNWATELHLGLALREEGRHREALAHFYRAAGMSPWYGQVWENIAESEQHLGNPKRAIEYYKKTLTIVSFPGQRKQIFWNMAIAYQSLGDEPSAQECFYQAAHQPETIDWQGDWWRDLLPIIRERFRNWRTGPGASPGR